MISLTWAKAAHNSLYLRSRMGGLAPFVTANQAGAENLWMRGTLWKKDALVCGPGHCSKAGARGAAGREWAGNRGWMGKERKSEQPGSEVFLGAEEN